LKSLLKSVTDFFDSSSDEKVIVALCSALREWALTGGTTKGTHSAVDATVSSYVKY
jgi:hypothetical protein